MKIKSLLISLLVIFLFSSCAQLSQLANFASCEFRTTKVENVNLAGIDVQNTKSLSDLNLLTVGNLLKTVATGKLPLSFVLNVEAKNPNTSLAAMNKIQWIAILDSTELTRGVIDQRVEIQPNSTAIVPINISADLKEIFKGETGKSLINLGLNLAGSDGSPSSRLTIKIKPSILIGNYPLEYPGFITVSKEFGNKVE